METLLLSGALIAGLWVLVISADKFVEGASLLAKLLGMPALLVGMIVVGFGTSAPEMTVSILSAVEGSPELALGNAYGSNICNIALILGVCALIAPVVVRRSAALREIPPLLLVSLLSMWLLRDGAIGRPDALVLLALFLISLTISAVAGIREERALQREKGAADPVAEVVPEKQSKKGVLRALVLLAGGLLFLILSSKVLVWAAVGLATKAGVSPLIIGLTIVAVGTSLPELASSVAAMRRREDDIAVGNILGSNLFNTLAVVGLAGAISPLKSVDPLVLRRDLPVMLALTVALFLFGFPYRKGAHGRLTRPVGILFLAAYIGYLIVL